MTTVAPWLADSRWATVPIRFAARLGTGHTPSRAKPEYWENCTIPWVTLADVWQLRSGATDYLNETKENISEVGLANSAAVVHPAGTVILSRTASVGFSAIMKKGMATSQDFATWTCSPRLHPRFLLYVLRATAPDLRRIAAGSTHKTVYMPDIEQLRTPLPPINVQSALVAYLDRAVAGLDSLAEARRRQSALIENRLESVWSTRIDQLMTACRPTPLRRVTTAMCDGPFGSALTSSHYTDQGARVIRLGNVGRAEFLPSDEAYIAESYFFRLRRHEAMPGDLVIAGLGDKNHPLGRASVVPAGLGPAIVKADCFRVRLDENRISHDFAAWALSSGPVSQQISALRRGSTRSRINLEVVRDIELPIPSLAAQADLVEELSELRRICKSATAAISEQIGLIEERKRSLIAAAVTGHATADDAAYLN
ncbi:restriction endonuclease subunit S [Micromonospora sp. BL4]|uniref:restriction endonuclease subunit S n=1 Tax=Micromonospora sp. BL4 TaxID=2478710 RepID=UPI000EF5930D|nr:restriction endonuclease subunit S [Micromonospora sp. BL4]RLP89287.1 restriction endonuclease subunit S [Micromonospora sp. BL4]